MINIFLIQKSSILASEAMVESIEKHPDFKKMTPRDVMVAAHLVAIKSFGLFSSKEEACNSYAETSIFGIETLESFSEAAANRGKFILAQMEP